MIKTCLQCGKEYIAPRTTSKYCCRNCQIQSMMHRDTTICPTCGKTIVARHSLQRKFCSEECMVKSRQEAYQKTRIYKNCPVCGSLFEVTRVRTKFCSRTCCNKGKISPHIHNVSDEGRKQMQDNLKNHWKDPNFRKIVVDRMTTNNPSQNPEILEKMKTTRRNNNSYSNNFKYGNGKISEYEQKVYDKLLLLGFIYNAPIKTKLACERYPEEQYPHCYKPDFSNLTTKICIEIDGNNHNSSEAKQLDAKKDKCLQFLGYKIIRFTHKDIDEGEFDKWLSSYQKGI